MPQATSPNTTATPTAPSRAAYERQVLVTLAGLFAPANEAAPMLANCPFCKVQPEIKTAFYDRAVIFCDQDDCDEHPQAMGDTVALAAATWNQRIEDGESV